MKSFLKSVDIADYLKFGLDEIDQNKDTSISIKQENTIEESNSWLDKLNEQKKRM